MSERAPAGSGSTLSSVAVWDLPTRLFHWLLVVLVVAQVVTANLGGNAMDWHKRFGYAVLALLIFRLAWGFLGSTYARFGSFLAGPRAVLAYLGEIAGRRPATLHVGHNPLGGWSVALMLLALLVQAATGLFSNDDVMIEGPLFKLVSKDTSDVITGVHKAGVYVLLALIALHVAAVLYYRLVKGEDLVTPMLLGRKRLPASTPQAEGGHPLLALALLAASGTAVWYVATRV